MQTVLLLIMQMFISHLLVGFHALLHNNLFEATAAEKNVIIIIIKINRRTATATAAAAVKLI